MPVDRKLAARMGLETSAILSTGRYVVDGREVSLRAAIAQSREATKSYPPQVSLPLPALRGLSSAVEVVNESTLAAAHRAVSAGRSTVALNFASAKNPGGGFRGGARAQEESLARASTLVASIEDDPMYAHHRALRDTLYTSWAIYSPQVAVFRDEAGALLEEPWRCAFITAPAPNAKVVLERAPERGPEIQAALRERIDRVLRIASLHGHDALVLGAWGCGVFGNDPQFVAGAFADALATSFAGVFAQVTFAVLDWSAEQRFIGPFRERFARPGLLP